MKHFLTYLLLLLCSFAYGHEYYFGYAEVEYNEITQKYEATLVMSTHDMEMALREEFGIHTELGLWTAETPETAKIAEYISSHFSLTQDTAIPFDLIGFESLPNGITHFYLESQPVELKLALHWRFDLLMDHFSEQQNKLTFYFRDQQHTITFLPTAPSQTLKLETNGL